MNEGINSGFKKFAGSSDQADDLSLLTLFIKKDINEIKTYYFFCSSSCFI